MTSPDPRLAALRDLCAAASIAIPGFEPEPNPYINMAGSVCLHHANLTALLDALAAAEKERALDRAAFEDLAKNLERERDAIAARLAGAERVVAAARATYEEDDVWTEAGTDGGHRQRDKAMGAALRAYDDVVGEGRGTV